mmetsp:Transcript_9630/g.22121  ORF Transcript_9630/g.22121 Transcript_9630/m.22121 type:complete len:237 (+) Transcript_9630:18-728(+)
MSLATEAFLFAEQAAAADTVGNAETAMDLHTQAVDFLMNAAAVEQSPTTQAVLKKRAGEMLTRAEQLRRSLGEKHKSRRTVPNLVKGLSVPTTDVQRAAAASLWELSYSDPQSKVMIGKYGAIPPLLELLSSPDLKTQERASGALAMLCCQCDPNKEIMHQVGAVRILQNKLLTCKDPSVLVNVIQAINNLAVNTPFKSEVATGEVIECLRVQAQADNAELRENAQVALSNMTHHH